MIEIDIHIYILRILRIDDTKRNICCIAQCSSDNMTNFIIYLN